MSRVEEGNSNLLSIWRITYETTNQRRTSSELVALPSLTEATNYGLERAKELDSNSRAELLKRKGSAALTFKGPIVVLFARLAFAVLAQGLVAGIFALQSSSEPWRSAAPWWPVYGTLIDIGCLGLLWWFTRKEGLRLFGLISFDRRKWQRDVLIGVGLFAVSFPIATGGIFGSSLLVFGKPQAPTVYGNLSLLPALYSVLVFPAIWGMTEEMTYNGYLLPRIQALSGSNILALVVVSFAWALQHIALPLTFDPRFMLFRFISFIPLALLWTVLYLRLRRLLPFIVAHWGLDALGTVNGILIPLLFSH